MKPIPRMRFFFRAAFCYSLILLLSSALPLIHAGEVEGKSSEKTFGQPAAPDFTLRTMDGEPFTLSKNLHKGPIILHFWATWCLPCMAEMKAMKTALEARKQTNLQVLSVSVDDNKTSAKVKGHVRARKYPFTILMDDEKKVYDAFQVANCPQLFLLDKDGSIVYSHTGFTNGDEKQLMARLDALDAPEK